MVGVTDHEFKIKINIRLPQFITTQYLRGHLNTQIFVIPTKEGTHEF